jgi:hypothetical protein
MSDQRRITVGRVAQSDRGIRAPLRLEAVERKQQERPSGLIGMMAQEDRRVLGVVQPNESGMQVRLRDAAAGSHAVCHVLEAETAIDALGR